MRGIRAQAGLSGERLLSELREGDSAQGHLPVPERHPAVQREGEQGPAAADGGHLQGDHRPGEVRAGPERQAQGCQRRVPEAAGRAGVAQCG